MATKNEINVARARMTGEKTMIHLYTGVLWVHLPSYLPIPIDMPLAFTFLSWESGNEVKGCDGRLLSVLRDKHYYHNTKNGMLARGRNNAAKFSNHIMKITRFLSPKLEYTPFETQALFSDTLSSFVSMDRIPPFAKPVLLKPSFRNGEMRTYIFQDGGILIEDSLYRSYGTYNEFYGANRNIVLRKLSHQNFEIIRGRP